jgi:hypothetical protein
MKRLSKPQQVRLIELVIDTHGGGLNKRVFTDVVFTLFEDISGMEVLTPPDAREIINNLWSIYRGNNKP